jgi:hypothetical protein
MFSDKEPECGFHLEGAFVPRIAGLNTATTFGEWPHVCAIFKVCYVKYFINGVDGRCREIFDLSLPFSRDRLL